MNGSFEGRILFVDDEQGLLDGLRGALRKERKRWDMHFALGGAAALELLAKHEFDVVVSDMKMAPMDGADLLHEVHRRYPSVLRFVLSGQCEENMTLRAIPVTHRWLSKPCDRQELVGTLQSAIDTRNLLQDPCLRKVVGEVTQLPQAPSVFLRLMDALSDPRASLTEVTALIELDPSISARVLQITNSAFFALARKVSSVKEAVVYLGIHGISQLVLACELFGSAPRLQGRYLSMESFQLHSLQVARMAGWLLRDHKVMAEQAVTAGLLHDLGKIVLGMAMPEECERFSALQSERGCRLAVVEKESLGVSHAEVGAALLSSWGLPLPIFEAVALHHESDEVVARNPVLAAVVLADLADQECEDRLLLDEIDDAVFAAVSEQSPYLVRQALREERDRSQPRVEFAP